MSIKNDSEKETISSFKKSIRPRPRRVSAPNEKSVDCGGVPADRIKSLDWRGRKAQVATSVPADLIGEILGKLNALVS
jgi:hypothetical protein